jgi:hypothetical protein
MNILNFNFVRKKKSFSKRILIDKVEVLLLLLVLEEKFLSGFCFMGKCEGSNKWLNLYEVTQAVDKQHSLTQAWLFKKKKKIWRGEIYVGLDPVFNGSKETRMHLTRCVNSCFWVFKNEP